MKVSISVLGGVGEVGMNMYVYETEKTAVIVDCGIKFPPPDDLGAELIIPDFSYLESIKDKLAIAAITHSHEDHAGALPYLLEEYPLPIAASSYSLTVIDRRMKERRLKPENICFSETSPLEVGDFKITFIPVSHSVPGTGALLIETADGFSALHISDYKIDFSPVAGSPFPAARFAELGEKGLDCLAGDSTNSLVKGFTGGERSVAEKLEKIFAQSAGRIFFTTFSSNMERLQTVINIAEKYGRKIAVEGPSLIKNMEDARKKGLLRLKEETFVQGRHISRIKDANLCVIATGSQGEPASVISKIVNNDYGRISMKKGDAFIFSSRVVPGNEQKIARIKNRIAQEGCFSFTAESKDVHVSGHASEEDMKLLLKLAKPRYLIPVHGENIHIERHRAVAVETGMSQKNIICMDCGRRVNFSGRVLSSIEEIPAGKRIVDTKGDVISREEFWERKRLATDGAAFIYARVNLEKGTFEGLIKAAVLGFSMTPEKTAELENVLKNEGETQSFEKFASAGWEEVLRKSAKKYFKKVIGRRPVINVALEENR